MTNLEARAIRDTIMVKPNPDYWYFPGSIYGRKVMIDMALLRRNMARSGDIEVKWKQDFTDQDTGNTFEACLWDVGLDRKLTAGPVKY